MKKTLASALTSYREFRAAKARNRPYRVIRTLIISLVAAYLLLLSFPQVLFAHEVTYKNFYGLFKRASGSKRLCGAR